MEEKYIEWGEYLGNPMIILRDNANDNKPSQFGLVKAKLYLAHLTIIKQFVDEEKNEPIVIKKDENDRFPITLTLHRAKLIMRYVNEIQKFVKDGRAPKPDTVNLSCLFGVADFDNVSNEDKAKLVALKAYMLGAAPCNINEKAVLIETAKQASLKISDETDNIDSLYKKLFFLIILSELFRQDNPMPYRNEALKISSRIDVLRRPNPFLYYSKIIDYITAKTTTRAFRDITASPAEKIEKQLEAIAKHILDLSIYSLSKPIQKYLFYDKLDDLANRI